MRPFIKSAALPIVLTALLGACVGPPSERQEATPPQRPMKQRPAPQRPVSPPPAAPAPAPTPAAASVQRPAPLDWQDRPLAPGSWSYRGDGGASTASFGADGAMAFRCDRAARRIAIVRAGVGQGGMTIRTTAGASMLPATVNGGQTVALRAASDPVFDQIAYSRGKFMVEIAGLPPLIMPSWAEISRVVEDCRG